MTNNENLFNQLTEQVNFALISQRNIILVCAFAISVATFKNTFNHFMNKYLVVILFGYAIAVGIKSIIDFNYYIKKTKKETKSSGTSGTNVDLELIDRYSSWIYFTYVLLIIIVIILLTFGQIEFFDKTHKILGTHMR